MKFVRVDDNPYPQTAGSRRRTWSEWWNAWYVQAGLLILAFLLGSVVYRSGIIRPVTLFARNIITQGPLSTAMPPAVQDAAKNVQDEIRMYENNGLPTMYIDIPFKNYQKLQAKRDEAVKLGILNTTDADFVTAQVHLKDGPKMDVKMRLKGDWADHLQPNKWSFRFQMKGNDQVLGATQFNIQTPAARNFLNEWAFHQNLIKEGVLTPRYQFINVLLNGDLWGIYSIEEHFAPELIESQGRRAGVIIRFNEDPMWANMSSFWANHIYQGSNLSVTDEWSTLIDAFQDTKIAQDPTLSAEAKTAEDMLRAFQTGQRPASEILDVDLWGRFFALHDLWDARHGVAWHNLRFYYNPVTGKLEPVAYDAEPFEGTDTPATIVSDFIQTRIFNDPQIRAAYARELERVTSPEYIDSLMRGLVPEHDRLLAALKAEFPKNDMIAKKSVVVDWDRLKARAASLRLELQPAVVVRGSYQASNVLRGSTGKPSLTLDLVNMMLLPVEVERVEIDGKPISVGDKPITLQPVMDPATQAFQPVRITIPLSSSSGLDKAAPKVEAVVRVAGLQREFRATLSGVPMPENLLVGPTPHQPTVDEVLKQHPFLEKDPTRSSALAVSPGDWDVEGDLILPDNTDLFIPAGTALRFSKGSILYATGALYLLGTQDAPVVLTAQKDTWGGIVVLNTDRDSLWQYALVDKTGGIDRQGWVTTGGITFFQSTIVLEHTLLGNNQTEDAINVIHGVFKFHDCEFANTFADALDSDFSTGEVTNCYFHDVAGDAVDVSGTQATISGSRMERVTDKGVSVGEQSDITVNDVKMDTVGIGVASKDLSKAMVTQTEIRKARFSALAAYIKKPVYGPASIEARGVTVLDTEKAAVVQKGSTILIDGKAVPSVDLDVEQLYKEKILGN